jgi:hypothetical protein
MAWTSPMTWTDDTVLCASQLNLHLRDNLLETMVAKTTAASTFVVADNRSHLVERTPGSAEVQTSETCTSEEYEDLDTVGPSLTRTCGRAVLLIWGCGMTASGPGNTDEAIGWVSVAISRSDVESIDSDEADEVLEASDAHALIKKGQDNGDPPAQVFQAATHLMLHNLGGEEDGGDADEVESAASYDFTLKYRTNGKTVSFQRRQLFVWPMS